MGNASSAVLENIVQGSNCTEKQLYPAELRTNHPFSWSRRGREVAKKIHEAR